MTGRGIDQVLPHPSNPVLDEPYVRDARDYVDLAEKAHGRIARAVSFDYIWGEALNELKRARVDARLINLETAITAAETDWPGKGIHYRMHPGNIGCLSAARIDACALATNHVLDWGYDGLRETLRTLDQARIAHAGAGKDAQEGAAPAIVDLAGKGRVLFFSLGSTTSGIPQEWRATTERAGVNLLEDLSQTTAARVVKQMRAQQTPGDLLIASIHWGGNWGYEIPREQIAFAHTLIDNGVALVHGHSSHHVKGIDVYKGRLILYGCGDFLTDYEGISGYEKFRGDLGLMYFVELNPRSGDLIGLRMIPMQMRRFRLEHASAADSEWLRALLDRLGAQFGTAVRVEKDKSLTLSWH